MRISLRALALGALLVATTPAYSADLVIWWTKGISAQEDQLLRDAVSTWEAATGKTADLSFYASGDVAKKTLAALEAGEPPDLTFDFNYDLAYSPTWAYEGKLADVSDVLDPIQDLFESAALQSVEMENGLSGTRSYYAIPWTQMTPMIHYWGDLLEEAGFTDSDVPDQWLPFFTFWCDSFQPAIRKTGSRMYGLGQGSSSASNDSFFNIHMWLKAYGVDVLTPDGELTLTDPAVRERTIEAMTTYVQPILDECAPPDAMTWKGADDNTGFLNKQFMLEMNPTLSIPISLLPDQEDVYHNVMRTVPWPHAVDGSPMPALVSVKQALIFQTSPHQDNAKDFMRHLLQPEVIGAILRGGGGRFTPVMPDLLADPFYSDPADPHLSAMYKTFTQGTNLPYPHAYNRLYAKVMSQGTWQQGIGRVVVDGLTVDQAVDEIIARISDILAGK